MLDCKYQSAPLIDGRKSLFENFSSQKRCDVTFVCKNKDNNWIKIGAHKLYLSLVSEVFDTMFYGESVKNGAVTDNSEIKIEDISYEAFKLFLLFLYNGEVEFEHGSRLAEFYYAAHKYICAEALQFAKKLMLKQLCPKYVTIFHHIAVLYEVPDLKAECEKIITAQTDEVLRSSEFLKATPETVNFIFSLSQSTINSELDFIWALERYINFNKEDQPEIQNEVRPALQAIRFLTLTDTDIATTSLLTSEEKKAILACLSSKDETTMPESFSLEKSKREGEKTELIRALKDIFVPDKCCYCVKQGYSSGHAFWKCNNHYSPVPSLLTLKRIYEKYGHADLLRYSMEDVKLAYHICQQYGFIKKDSK